MKKIHCYCLNNKYWHFDNDIYDLNNFKEQFIKIVNLNCRKLSPSFISVTAAVWNV